MSCSPASAHFRARPNQDTIAAVLEREPDWQALPAKTPAKVRELLRQCLQKDAGRRLQQYRGRAQNHRGSTARMEPLASRRRRGRGLAMVAVGAALWLRGPARPLDRSQWVQLTKFPDSVSQPALSPDGRMVAFIRGNSTFFGPGQIYVKILPDGEPVATDARQLKQNESGVFSGRRAHRVYHSWTQDFNWDTWVVPVLGGEPQLLLKNASGLVWTGPRQVLFSEIKMGDHMGIVTAEESRVGERDVYMPADEPRWHTGPICRPMGNGCSWWKWTVTTCGSLAAWFPRTAVLRAARWATRRRLHLWRVVARWQMDVSHFQCRRRQSHLAATFSRWPAGADHFRPDRGGRHRHGAGRPLLCHSHGAAEHLAMASRRQRASGQISLEGNAAQPRFTPDGKKLLYRIVREPPSEFGFYRDLGEVRVADLKSGRSEPLVRGFAGARL